MIPVIRLISISAVNLRSVASGICFDGQAALPRCFNVPQIHVGPVRVCFLIKCFPQIAQVISPVNG